MDLGFTPQILEFRQQAREFIDANLPADLKAKVLGGQLLLKDDYYRWHVILNQRGWLAANWPVEFGGTGWDSAEQHVFEEECADAGAPILSTFSMRMVSPVIMAFGNRAQQEYFLPRILSGEHWWCQGYSEPGSGSDLASLKTRAVREGDHYIVNGQKTWTTLAHHANWIFCLVRTSSEGRAQEGISFLLIDMTTPGVRVRPIIMLDGTHEVNEVWFEDVRVPVANLVGEENRGWTYAKFLLGHERTGIAEVGRSKSRLKRLKAIASQQPGSKGKPLIDDSRFRDRIAQVEIDLMALEITNLRVVAADRDKKSPGPAASLLKVKGTEIQQSISELLMQTMDHYALAYQPEDGEFHAVGPDYGALLSAHYLNYRKVTIYGGSNEIQRNIVAKMILGF